MTKEEIEKIINSATTILLINDIGFALDHIDVKVELLRRTYYLVVRNKKDDLVAIIDIKEIRKMS